MTDLLTYLAYRAGAGIFGALPEPIIRRLGGWAGSLCWFWARERKAMAIRHMGRVLGRSDDARAVERVARDVFSAYGRYWAETLWFRPRRAEAVRSRVTLVGLEHVRAAQESGRPIVAALPHVGNWELAGTLAEDAGVRITAVAEALANRRLARWFVDLRARLGIRVVLAEGLSTMRALRNDMLEGRVIALVADRNIGGRCVEVEFFGERTTLPAGPAVLAIRNDAVLLPVVSYFKRGAGHRVVVHAPIEDPGPEDRNRMAGITQRLAHRYEDMIREAPTQWHLVQPNWPSDHDFLERHGGDA
ncbi:phosphatidylinositol mannoside acyltransferase [Candidatus Spongiisocius sp.]|uniref:phosphatidylinositol mannoside acyltransferase n=1 Tax=Candidatus Spongiisocius sp. TaxID=3101273 RepID=UPI003B59E4BD